MDAIEQPDDVLLKQVDQAPSTVKTDGLLVHQGVQEDGPSWVDVIDNVREERMKILLAMPLD